MGSKKEQATVHAQHVSGPPVPRGQEGKRGGFMVSIMAGGGGMMVGMMSGGMGYYYQRNFHPIYDHSEFGAINDYMQKTQETQMMIGMDHSPYGQGAYWPS